MQPPDQLVVYARQIAVYRAYDNLENGLQPVSALHAKLEHEQQEFNEAVAKKDIWHQYHEAADLLYYSACIGYQVMINSRVNPTPYLLYYSQFPTIRSAGLNHKKAEKAALAKYGWRASGPGRKDELYEIELIKQALQ